MTAILGISAFYHDSAAALLVDGEIVAAAQEERFTRRKHDPSFPKQSISWCLEQSDLKIEDLDHVVFYEKPFLKFERLLETYLQYAPRGLGSFRTSMPIWLGSKIYTSRVIQKELEGRYKKRLIFPEHHESHAASAFFPSPFEESAILTVDGVGEWATTTLGIGSSNRIELTQQICFPDSLGLLYSAFTYFCGFRVNGGEGKLMGLAPYGQPVYADVILQELIDLKPDGSFRLDQSFFNYAAGDTMTSRKFALLFDGAPRVPESEITSREKNLAASIQSVTETILLQITRYLHHQTGMKNLCIAGGVGLNCVANGVLLRESPFENIWVQPAAGDSGGAIGAALFAWHQLLNKPRNPRRHSTTNLGPKFNPTQTQMELNRLGAVFQTTPDHQNLCDRAAQQLSSGQVVGWMQGPMEFGPRALGCRSILADPRSPDMQEILNRKVKFREPFRPFAPAILSAQANDYFELNQNSPLMLFAAKTRVPNVDLAKIPAATHVDGSARVQTVSAEDNDRLHHLLKAFERKTGCPVLLNTSFNVRGEPIVCSISDAYRCFMKSQMDALAIENCWLIKSEQPPFNDLQTDEPPIPLRQRFLDVWMTITFPIRYLVANLLMTLIFLFCIFPIGLIWRVFNRSSFQPIQKSARSYWIFRQKNESKPSYFKQY